MARLTVTRGDPRMSSFFDKAKDAAEKAVEVATAHIDAVDSSVARLDNSAGTTAQSDQGR